MDGTLRELPKEWIARLFTRFQSIYGSKAEMMWGKADQPDLLQTWGDELAGFEGADIRAALDIMSSAHLGYPPTLYEFAALCRDARIKRTGNTALLPAPKTRWEDVPQAIRDEITRFLDHRRERDPKDWARRILAEADVGEYLLPYGVHCAKVALGLAVE